MKTNLLDDGVVDTLISSAGDPRQSRKSGTTDLARPALRITQLTAFTAEHHGTGCRGSTTRRVRPQRLPHSNLLHRPILKKAIAATNADVVLAVAPFKFTFVAGYIDVLRQGSRAVRVADERSV